MPSSASDSGVAAQFLAITNRSKRVDLAAVDPAATNAVKRKRAVDDVERGDLHQRLARLADLLDANKDRSILLVLQGLDGSGKSGIVKHVIGAMTPAIVRVRSFKEPTPAEKRHDFLWRIKEELPDPGQLVVFDRSHYEDLVAPCVSGDLDAAGFKKRAATINRFERELTNGHTEVIKLFLHLSYDAQRERFLRRLRRPDKRWKFSENDLNNRDHWDENQAAFSWAMGLTNTSTAPWYVVPADKRWHRNWVAANIIAERLEALNLSYPQPSLDDTAIKARLKASASS